jgi:hypothetical protein
MGRIGEMLMIAWIDRGRRKYTMDEITDSHLVNILKFLCKGGGYMDFVTPEKIIELFEEAERRDLEHTQSLGTAIMLYGLRTMKEDGCLW